SNAGEEIPSQRALLSGDNAVHHLIEEPSIDLKECAVIYAVVGVRRGVRKGGRSPLREGSWRVSWPAAGGQLSAVQLRKALAQSGGDRFDAQLTRLSDKECCQKRRLIRIAK